MDDREYAQALHLLGDVIQDACAAAETAGVEVIGFTVLVNRPDKGVATAETRTRTTRAEFVRALGIYVEAERMDQAGTRALGGDPEPPRGG